VRLPSASALQPVGILTRRPRPAGSLTGAQAAAEDNDPDLDEDVYDVDEDDEDDEDDE
jgi:hypothetical protein